MAERREGWTKGGTEAISHLKAVKVCGERIRDYKYKL